MRWLTFAALLVPAEAILDAMRCEANTLTMCLDGAMTYSVVGGNCIAFCKNECHPEGNFFMTTYCVPYATFFLPLLLLIFLCTLIRLLKAMFCFGQNKYSTQMR